jgi:hypothetical protein
MMTEPLSVFQRHRIGLPDDEHGDRGTLVNVPAGQARTYISLVDRVILQAPDYLDVLVPPISLVSVTGSPETKVRIRVWAELSETTTAEAFAAVRLVCEGGAVHLTGLPTLPMSAILRWDVTAPAARPLSVTSDHAAVDIFGITGPINVATAHGRVSVLESGPKVIVNAAEGGSILWSGKPEGIVDLTADGQIKLRFTESQGLGKIHASARESIDVYVPTEFASAFRAEVPAPDRLICDDITRARLKKANGGSRPAFQSGSDPIARFVSRKGTISIHRYDS